MFFESHNPRANLESRDPHLASRSAIWRVWQEHYKRVWQISHRCKCCSPTSKRPSALGLTWIIGKVSLYPGSASTYFPRKIFPFRGWAAFAGGGGGRGARHSMCCKLGDQGYAIISPWCREIQAPSSPSACTASLPARGSPLLADAVCTRRWVQANYFHYFLLISALHSSKALETLNQQEYANLRLGHRGTAWRSGGDWWQLLPSLWRGLMWISSCLLTGGGRSRTFKVSSNLGRLWIPLPAEWFSMLYSSRKWRKFSKAALSKVGGH